MLKHEIPAHVAAAFRPGTVDRDIWYEAVELNAYELPHLFQYGNNVLNIGAHTGSVAWRCAMGGADVVAVEPSHDNYHVLMNNMAPVTDKVLTIHAAAWRSDIPPTTLQFEPNWQPCNTGGGAVLGDNGGKGYYVFALPLDEILKIKERWRYIIIDCEGSEFPCLYTSKLLNRVDSIVGEFHERSEVRDFADVGQPYMMEPLRTFLEDQGYVVRVERKGPGMGLFWADRP